MNENWKYIIILSLSLAEVYYNFSEFKTNLNIYLNIKYVAVSSLKPNTNFFITNKGQLVTLL